MKKSLPAISVTAGLPANMAVKCNKSIEDESSPTAKRQGQRIAPFRLRQSGKMHFRFAGHLAFGATVCVSMIAAATDASHDIPLMLGGF